MQKILLSLVAVALLLAPAGQTTAEELKPLVTVSFAGYDKALESLGTLGQVAGDPQLASKLEMILKAMTQGKGLTGLDTKRPWAVVAFWDGNQPVVYGFLPVSDLKQLIEAAKSNPGLAEQITENNGVYQIQAGPQAIYIKQKDSWAVVTNESENLDKAPADPTTFLGDLPTRYALAAQLTLANLPDQYREQFLAQVRAGMEAGMAQMPNETDAQYAARVFYAKQLIEQVNAVVTDAESVLLGWAVDSTNNSTHLDLEFTAKAGTKLAERLALVKPGQSDFAGFLLPDAAVRISQVQTLTDADVTQAKSALAVMRKSMLDNLQNELAKNKQGAKKFDPKVLEGLVNDAFDVLDKTIETKKKDVGMSVVLDPKATTLVLGSAIAEGEKLQDVLKRFVDEAVKANPEAAKQVEYQFNAETYEGFRLNTFSIVNPSPKFAELVGERVELVVAIANDKMAVSAGRDAMKALKTAIDQSKAKAGTEVLPLEFSISATPLAKFVASVADVEQAKAAATLLATTLEKSGGKDRLLLTVRPITQGLRIRVELEEGILKAMGLLAQLRQAGAVTPPGE